VLTCYSTPDTDTCISDTRNVLSPNKLMFAEDNGGISPIVSIYSDGSASASHRTRTSANETLKSSEAEELAFGLGKLEKSQVTSVPTSRDAPCRGTNSRLRSLKSLPRKSVNIYSICHCSPPLSPPGNQSVTRTTAVSVTLSIASLSPSIAASAAPPCSITIVGVSSKLGVLEGKFHQERIWLES
jgi:hypothetical protein